jgi:oligopeptide/dipeptide ABC transporter ATP-binding protein
MSTGGMGTGRMSTGHMSTGHVSTGGMTGEPLLRVEGLHVGFHAGDTARMVVRGVDLSIAAGEVVGLVGESGSGKSLTALSIMRLLPPGAQVTSGRISFRGEDVLEMKHSALNRLRGGAIGMIFQDPLSALNPAITIGAQLTDAIRSHQPLGARAARDRAAELLSLVGIPFARERLRAYPHELSGGMRQRVMIALAVSSNPALLIADEPTTALDVTVQAQVMDLIDRIRREFGLAVLFISHNLDLVAEIADRVTVMYAGRAVESGDVETLFAAPLHPYTRRLISCIPRLDGGTGAMATIPGLPPMAVRLPPGCPFAPRCEQADAACEAAEPPMRWRGTHMAACFQAGP